MLEDIIANTLSALLILIFTPVLLFFYYKYVEKKSQDFDIHKIKFRKFLLSFFSKIVLEKIDQNMFENEEEISEGVQDNIPINVENRSDALQNSKPENDEIIFQGRQDSISDTEEIELRSSKYSITEIPFEKVSNPNDKESILIRSSKDYGENSNFSVRTWFGVNFEKLNQEKYKYICFKIKNVKDIYFLKKDFVKLIKDNIVDPTEKNKYVTRNSFDTYLMKSKTDEKWYITRLGSHLEKYIEVK